ncbi:MAG TPA: hypothetical protein VII06_08455 [Chloroflexota bacterium]|jgi:hypothetical protein
MNRPAREISKQDHVERFRVNVWTEIFQLYPNQWLAFAVEESLLHCGTTGGRIIAKGEDDKKVFAKLMEFRDENPGQEVGFLYTGRYLKRGQEVLDVMDIVDVM